MIDWIGHLIANWPFWLVIVVLAVAAIVYFFIELAPAWPMHRTWWQDEQTSPKKDTQRSQAKAKKG